MKKSDRLVGKGKKKVNKEGWKKNKARKFSNKEQRELDGLPLRIEELDQRKEKVVTVLADSATYTGDPKVAKEAKDESGSIEAELEDAYARWEELEALKESLASL